MNDDHEEAEDVEPEGGLHVQGLAKGDLKTK